MIQRNPLTRVHNILLALVLLVSAVALSGCSDSQEASAVNQASTSVDQGGRMILAAGQMNLQAMEKGEADKAFGELEVAIQQVADQIGEAEGSDEQDLLDLSRRLGALSSQMVSKYAEVSNSRPENLQRRLKRAKELLEAASRDATGPARTAPALLLGTLHLTEARDLRERLDEFKLVVQGRHVDLLNLADSLITEIGYLRGLPGQFPRDRMIADLSGRIDADSGRGGEVDSLDEQLQQSKETIIEMEKQRADSMKRVGEFQSLVREKHNKYVSLLEQAKDQRGSKRYELQNEAYAVRSGIDSDGNGLTFYEALAESEQYNLERTEVILQIEQLRQDQLEKQIATITQSIAQLTESPINGEIETGMTVSSRRVEELVSRGLTSLESLDEAETIYFEARKGVVVAYRNAKKSYRQAISATGRNRKTYDYAELRVQQVSSELSNAAFSYDDPGTYSTETAGLWQEEASFYDSLAALTGVLASLSPLQEVATEYRDAYAGKADQARQSMLDESPESNGQ